MKIKRRMLYASVLSFLGLYISVQFNACSEVRFEPSAAESLKTGDPTDDNPPPVMPPPTTQPPIEVVRATCENTTHMTYQQSITFADPGRTCPFGQNDNNARRNEYHSARIEDSVNINIPAGAIICDMDFQFATQAFWYDDYFAFTLDGYILAASHDFESYGLEHSNGLPKWDWSRIRGKRWVSTGTATKCASVLGQNGTVHQGTCSFPNTNTQGQIRLDFPNEVFYQLLDGDSGNHSFGFITTGDDDTSDCRHSTINFNIEVKYVIPTE